MLYTVYILKDRFNRIYIGQTQHIDKRVKEHTLGKTKSLHGRGPFSLIYTENFSSHVEAVNRERDLKSGQGRAWLKSTILKRMDSATLKH
jgi:putative endonuclease